MIQLCSDPTLVADSERGEGTGRLENEERTERLAEVARRLNLSSYYSSVEERYLGILVQEPAETGGLLSPDE